MITNLDRSGWFGASDTSYVIRKDRTTKSWLEWWDVKMGRREAPQLHTREIDAGTAWEHKILEEINPKIRKDFQIKIDKLGLRVNYDGDLDNTIYEVKTHNYLKEFKMPNAYKHQAYVEMFAWKKHFGKLPKLYIALYSLIDSEYENYSTAVDSNRISFYEVKYDKSWINGVYLPNLKELCRAMRKGGIPK